MDYWPSPKLIGRLTAEDFPTASVTVTTQDGSICRFRDAFYHREDGWIAIYTKQAGYHMFRLTTISSIKGMVRTTDDKFAFL